MSHDNYGDESGDEDFVALTYIPARRIARDGRVERHNVIEDWLVRNHRRRTACIEMATWVRAVLSGGVELSDFEWTNTATGQQFATAVVPGTDTLVVFFVSVATEVYRITFSEMIDWP